MDEWKATIEAFAIVKRDCPPQLTAQMMELEKALNSLGEAWNRRATNPLLTDGGISRLETVGEEWTPCVKLPIVVHFRKQREGESHVSTREGITPILPTDLIMRGVQGEEYPIGRELFEKTYTLDVRRSDAEAIIAGLQARIDALMLEYCPEDMTPEQLAEWARNQKPAPLEAESEPVAVFNGYYGSIPTIKPMLDAILPIGMALYAAPHPTDRNAVIEELAAWIEQQRNDIPATGKEFAAALRALKTNAKFNGGIEHVRCNDGS